jgi:hypothetical protein
MPRSWIHVGRCWTHGEPFLAMDADLLPLWRGSRDSDVEDAVVRLGHQTTTLPVGSGTAAVILPDPEVSDEGWLEVFRSADGRGDVAVVHAGGPDYPAVLAAALAHPEEDGEQGDLFAVPSGRLAIISAALDGTGEMGAVSSPERPGPLPASYDYDSDVDDAGGPLLEVGPRTFRLSVRWLVEVDEEAAFARWLLIGEDPA